MYIKHRPLAYLLSRVRNQHRKLKLFDKRAKRFKRYALTALATIMIISITVCAVVPDKSPLELQESIELSFSSKDEGKNDSKESSKTSANNKNDDKTASVESFENISDAEAINKEIKATKAEMETVKKEIKNLEKKIEDTKKKSDEYYQNYCKFLRNQYISGGSATLIEIMLEVDSVEQLLTRSEMVRSVSKQMNKALDELTAQKEKYEQQQADLKMKQTSLELKNGSLKSALAALESLKTLSTGSGQLKTANDATDDSDVYIVTDGKFSYPTSYRKVSAGYPYYNYGGYHGGLDFPCPKGTPVRAAADGIVILSRAMWYSYGHYIIIDHGDGLSTLYAHNSQLVVSVGDTVKRGDIIAYSGSTGNASGPHCHFEVRVNGSRVNPYNYLKN